MHSRLPTFYLSCLLAFTGGHLVNYSVILYLQESIGSDLLSGIGFGLSFGSSIVFGWFAGVLCDRISPTRVIQGAQVLFMLCLAGLWWADSGANAQTRVAWVLGSAFLGGLGWSFTGPARLSTLGQIAPPEALKPATIVFNLQVLIGFGLAPLLLGLVRSQSGWSCVFATGLALFATSSLLLVGTRTHGTQRRGTSVWADVQEGFACVRANPLLAQLMVAAVIAYAMTGPMQIILPKLAREVLGLSESQRGFYLGWMALSLIAGGVSALLLGKHLHHGVTIFGGIVVASLLFASLSAWTGALVSAAVLGSVGLLGGLVISLVVAGIQGQAPAAARGRVMGIYSIISQVVPALSGVAAATLVRGLGVTQSLLLCGGGLALVALLAAQRMAQLRHSG